MLEAWIKKQGMTHAEFGALIGRGRLAVLRYCHGKQVPRPDVAQRIEAVTGGEVPAWALYSACASRPSQAGVTA